MKHTSLIRSLSVILLLFSSVLSGLCAGISNVFLTPAISYTASDIETFGRSMMPVEVNVNDLLSKVYGVSDCRLDSVSCIENVVERIGMMPIEDEFGYWLDSADGYRLSYSGMAPEVSSMAKFRKGKIRDFAFFFLFPYAEGERDWANVRQARFAGNMLQEINDMGLDIAADDSDYFTAVTEYEDHPVQLFLREDDGQFVLGVHILM